MQHAQNYHVLNGKERVEDSDMYQNYPGGVWVTETVWFFSTHPYPTFFLLFYYFLIHKNASMLG